ncbi:helix-turn-helix domain-containing protein [Volucribacter psittacicida]
MGVIDKEWNTLYYFVIVAKHQGFMAAARELKVSPSVLSHTEIFIDS